MLVTFNLEQEGLGATGYAYLTIGYGQAWHPIDMDNDEGEHDFPEGVTKFVLQVQMEGDAGGSVKVTMTRDGGAAVKPDFKRAIANNEAGKTLVPLQVEYL